MEIARSAPGSEIHRCPYCHESVAPEATDGVACQQCLARHHGACWRELGRCSACQGTTPLAAADAARWAELAPVPSVAARDDEARREAARVLESTESRSAWLLPALLAPFTLGVFPIVDAESALSEHRARNAMELGPLPVVADDLRAKIQDARARSADAMMASKGMRHGFLALAGISVLVTFLMWFLEGTKHPDGFWVLIGACFEVMAFQAIYLNVFRETVRSHERHQLYARLVTDALPPDEIRRIVERNEADWSTRRAQDILLSVFSAFGLLLGPIGLAVIGARLRGALALHEAHEAALPRTPVVRK